MSPKTLEKILLAVIVAVPGVVYLYTVAPTLSFWDCGEFISSCQTLAVPHPPGMPFFIFLGKVWLMVMGAIAAVLPISKEVSWHMNLLGISFTLLSVVLVFKIIQRTLMTWRSNLSPNLILLISAATGLLVSFSFTFWENALETEVYSAATFFFLLIHYLVFRWYDSVRQNEPKNRFILLSFYLIFLFTGIQLMPFLMFVPIYIFIFFVERRYLRDGLLVLLGIFQLILFMIMFVVPITTATVVFLSLPLALGLILILNNHRRYSNWRFFLVGAGLVLVAVTTELYLPIRSHVLNRQYRDPAAQVKYLAGKNIAPRINENDPGDSWAAFNMVLHRAQYGPQRLLPRKTQEETGYNVIAGYFWQMAMYVRYLSWQVTPETVLPFFRGILYFLFYIMGFAGMFYLFKLDRRWFLLFILIMFMLSFAIVGYLNMKFSPSDSNPKHLGHEVRERDYFFHTGFTYFILFAGFGFAWFLEWFKKELKGHRLAQPLGAAGIIAFSVIPLFTNISVNNRYKNFAPKDYGYNMLLGCDSGGIIFTNGDNDTFPLWFTQEVMAFRRSVIVANLSLINTEWYIRQLKLWGVPIGFSDYTIRRLMPGVTEDRRVIYVKDIMIREIIAANAGIKLPERDYYIPGSEFAAKYLKGYRGRRPIYFATTVSPDNFEGFMPYMRVEGIVYRLTGDSVPYPNHLDVDKTQSYFYRDFRYTGILDPEKQKVLPSILYDYEKRKHDGEFYNIKVAKDDNTRILYTNYQIETYNLGLALLGRGDLPGAIKAWRFSMLFEAQETYPMLFYIGYAYAAMHQPDSADAYFSRVTVNNSGLIARIGAVYNETGYHDRAIDYFKRALAMNPRTPEASLGLVTSYIAQCDTAAAIGVLEDWLRLNPDDSSARDMYQMLKKGVWRNPALKKE